MSIFVRFFLDRGLGAAFFWGFGWAAVFALASDFLRPLSFYADGVISEKEEHVQCGNEQREQEGPNLSDE